MADCPKCRGLMTPGFAFLPDYGVRVKWFDGEPSAWKKLASSLGMGGRGTDLGSRRCSQCGFVEFFADPRAKAVKTLSTVEEETQRLRALVSTLQDRLSVLEAIATDPAERTTREIESLRDPNGNTSDSCRGR